MRQAAGGGTLIARPRAGYSHPVGGQLAFVTIPRGESCLSTTGAQTAPGRTLRRAVPDPTPAQMLDAPPDYADLIFRDRPPALTYAHSRERGMQPWRPRDATRRRLNVLLDWFSAHPTVLPVPGRSVMYETLDANPDGMDKDPWAVQVNRLLLKARRAGMLPWNALDDGGGAWHSPQQYADAEDYFRAQVKRIQAGFLGKRWDTQPVVSEIWVEAGGIYGQCVRITADYGLRVNLGQGFESTGDYWYLYALAERAVVRRWNASDLTNDDDTGAARVVRIGVVADNDPAAGPC